MYFVDIIFKRNFMKKILIITLCLFSLVACKGGSKKTVENDDFFDPAVPGGSNGSDSRLPALRSLNVTIMPDGRKSLTWIIPSTYVGQDYEIYLYRISGDGVTAPLPDPADTYSTAYLYKVSNPYTPIKTASYIDNTPLLSETTYSYYAYVNVGERWSSVAKFTITTPAFSNVVNMPGANDFWKKVTNILGSEPMGGALFVNTLSPGPSSIGNPSGSCAFAFDGGIMYCADTQNNRVMIYVSDSYLACKDYDKTSVDYEVCKAMYNGYPLSPVAVLGQKSLSTNYPCGHSSNPLDASQCLTSPRSIFVSKDNEVFIADSGNDRVKFYPIPPVYGCYHVLNFVGEQTPDECSPTKVVGKRDLFDLDNYSVITDGIASLDNPTGMAFNGGELYITDTGNHRVVTVKNFLDDEIFNCIGGSWKTATCRFSSVLGQQDFYSKRSFANEYTLGNITYSPGLDSLSDNGEFLKRHFANPTEIFIKDGAMVLVTNENFRDASSSPTFNLYSRILIYEQDPIGGVSSLCHSGNFNTVACEPSYIIGQESHEKLIELGNLDSYEDVPFSIKDIDIAFLGSYMFAIEKQSNQVKVWNSIENSSPGNGVPYSFKIQNPSGVYDSELSRNLPDLKGLSSIDVVDIVGAVYIFDGTGGKVYELPLAN